MLAVGYDCGSGARDALALADSLATSTGGAIVVASVFTRVGDRRHALRCVGEAVAHLDPERVADAVALSGRSATQALGELVATEGVDMLVLGKPPRAGAAAPCPIVIPPAGFAEAGTGRLRRVGVAFDGWAQSRAALQEAVSLARRARAEVCLLMVADGHTASSAEPVHDTEEALEDHRHAAERYLERELAELPAGLRASGRVIEGQVPAALATAAREEELDLLVMGSRARGPLRRVLPGSVSRALLHERPFAVMVIPGAPEPPLRLCRSHEPRGVRMREPSRLAEDLE